MRLTELLSRLSSVRSEGSDYLALCPAHKDGNPSLLVGQGDDGRILIYCRAGCQKDRILAALGLDMADLFSSDGKPDPAAPTLTAPDPEATEGPTLEQAAALAAWAYGAAERLREDTPEAEEARGYARDRFGLDDDLIRRFGLGLNPSGLEPPEGVVDFSSSFFQTPRLTIPFRDHRGRVVGLQGRGLRNHTVRWSGPINPPGGAWSKVGFFDLGTGLETVIVTEGPGDALTVAGAGLDAVAVRGAALARSKATTEALAEALKDRKVVVAGDNDDSGRLFTEDLARALTEAGVPAVFVMVWPVGTPEGEDLTSWRGRNPEGFPAALHAAVDAARRLDPDDDKDPPARNWTEVGMADMLRRRMRPTPDREGVLYAEGIGFHVWNGRTWVVDRQGQRVRKEAQEMALELWEEAAAALHADPKDDDAKAQMKAATRAQSAFFIDGIMKALSAMVLQDPEALDRHHHLLGVANGVVNLRTGDLRPHDPALLMTRCLDVPYDPEATAPRWESFLSEVFPDRPGLPGYVQRLVGYGITGETSEQAFAILWGTGANGKSVFTDTLLHVFRAVSVTTPFATFEAKPSGGIPNDLAALKGARLVFASEGEQGRQMAEAVIKRVTGQDMISARFMRQEFFEFAPTFLILLATNHKPKFRGQDEGLWRRVKMLPWVRYFRPEERDHYLQRRLLEEAPGILAWAVAGAREWYERGLQDPPEVVETTKGYREESDMAAGFLDHLVPEVGAKVPRADVYEAFKAWALDVEGWRESDLWAPRTFYAYLEEKGIPSRKGRHLGRNTLLLHGYRLATEAELAAGLDDDDPAPLPPVGVPK